MIVIKPKYGYRLVRIESDTPAQYTVTFIGQAGKTGKIWVEDIAGNHVYDYSDVSIDTDPKNVDVYGSELYGSVGDRFYKLCASVVDPSTGSVVEGPVCIIVPTVATQPTVLHNINGPNPKLVVVDLIDNIVLSFGLPSQGSVYLAYGGRLFSYVLYDNPDTGQGRLVMPDGAGGLVDTGYAKKVVITFSFGFNTLEDMKSWVVAHAIKNASDPAKIVDVALSVTDDTKLVEMLLPYALPSIAECFSGKLLGFDYDLTNYTIKAKILISMGWFNIDWGRLAAAAAWGGVWGLALGGPVGAAVGAGIGIVVDLVFQYWESTNINQVKQLEKQVKTVANEGKTKVDEAVNKALQDLEELHSAGEVSDEAYTVLKSDIESIRATAIEAIDKTVEEAVSAIRKAYEAGAKDQMKWIAIAGVGGFALGAIVAKK